MGTPREIEIKLDVAQADAAALRSRLTARFGSAQGRERLVSVYFDTARQALRKGGLTLRIRTIGNRRVQTVKAGDGAVGGLFQRSEWEADVAGDRPDLHAAKDSPVADVLANDQAPLLPLFETTIERTTWQVERDVSRIEVALDEGQAVAGDRATPIIELELELKSGETNDLFALLRDLAAESDLRPGVQAKSERGYALLRTKTRRAVKAEPVPLDPGMTTMEAFQAILRGCLRQFRLNEPLVAATRSAEPLHQARVGMRRLRAALSLFKHIVDDAEIDRLKMQLRAVSRRLGDARDLDVYLGHALAQEPPGPGVAARRADIERRREEAYDRVLADLVGTDFRRLMLDLMVWVEAGPWLTTDAPRRRALREQPVEGFAAAVLDKRRRAVKRKGRHLDRLDPPARHRVRIAAKKLRYAADFVAELTRQRKERHRHAAFIDAMEALQQTLGDLNDIETGRALAFGMAGAPGNSQTALVAAGHVNGGHVNGGHDDRRQGLLRAAVAGHRAFCGAKPFWSRWRNGARAG